MTTPAHTSRVTHRYTVHYPAHGPRRGDPHYRDFAAYRRRTHSTARCYVAVKAGPGGEAAAGCAGGLELHHAHIEFALQNGVDLAALDHDYPGVSDPDHVGAWVESAANLRWLCIWHHRGLGGAHTLTHADWEAAQYVHGLTT